MRNDTSTPDLHLASSPFTGLLRNPSLTTTREPIELMLTP